MRKKLDLDLGVSSWRVPGGTGPEAAPPRVTEDGLRIPSWWTDDEEASQSFLAGQGVTL